MFIRLGLLLLLSFGLLVHCAPSQNTCTPGTKGVCPCPDGTKGERICQNDRRMSACFCKTFQIPDATAEPTATGEEPSLQEGTTEPPPADSGPGQEPANPEPEPFVEPPPVSEAAPEAGPEPTPEPPTPEPVTADAGAEPLPECGPDCQASCDPPCSGGSRCVQGKCTCPQGRQLCALYCADTQHDPFHCGACDKACSADQACVSGACKCFYSKRIQLFDLGCSFITSIHFSHDSKMLVAIDDNGNGCGADLHLWDTQTRKPIHVYKKVTYRPKQLVILKDKETILLLGGNRFYRFSISQKQSITPIYFQIKTSTTHAVEEPSTQNPHVAVGTRDPSFIIVNNATRKTIKTVAGMSGTPVALAYRKDAKRLAAALSSKEVWVYDTQSWTVLKKLTGLSAPPTSIAYNNAGNLIAVGQQDSKIVLWEPDSGKTQRTISFSSTFVYNIFNVAFSADGKHVFSAWADRTAKIHEVATGRLVHTLGQHRNEVRAFDASPDGKFIVTGAGTQVQWWGCSP